MKLPRAALIFAFALSLSVTGAAANIPTIVGDPFSWGPRAASAGANSPRDEAGALPVAIQSQIDAMDISKRPVADLVAELYADRDSSRDKGNSEEQRKAAADAYKHLIGEMSREARMRAVLRYIYGQDQLLEKMTWFWANHFNIFSDKGEIGVMLADYEDKAIRPYALGRYRDLLEATLRHPAMLRYLDNAQNAVGHINENYAREIMELHSMGVGSGYTQKDVQELARILTGVGINGKPGSPKMAPRLLPLYIRDGLFEFNPGRHDFGDKIFLGHTIKGSGYDEVEQALDLIAASPATAHHVSERLATYFAGDEPPQALVDAMAATFRNTNGDIAAVLRTMADSPAFKPKAFAPFKDPVQYVISAVRLSYGDRVITNPRPIVDWIRLLGEGLYAHQTPDGYSLNSVAWNGPGQMASRFEFARQLGAGTIRLFQPPDKTVPVQPEVPQIRDSAYFKRIEPALSAQTRAALAQARSPQEWNALFLASPEFMRR